MSEINLRKCKDCGEYKPRVNSGRFDANNKRYREFNGATWNGNRCGECHKALTKERMRKLREERKNVKVE